MTATIEEKAVAILTSGRLTVTRLFGDGLIVAEVVGTRGAVYYLGYDPRRREWRCTCPVPGRRACSHLAALRLVVDEPGAPLHNRDDDDHDDEGRG